MRVVFDLTDDDAPTGQGGFPSPSTIASDGDDVVIALREVEVRMTFPQFLDFLEACNAWHFRGARADGRPIDEAGDHIPEEEHHRLRKIVGAMMNDGQVGRAAVPVDVRDALRCALAESDVRAEAWRTKQDEVLALQSALDEAREEIKALRASKRAQARRRTAPAPTLGPRIARPGDHE